MKATDNGGDWNNASLNTRWAASVASFGMVLRDSKYKGNSTFDSVKNWAVAAKGADLDGYRSEMIGLIESASILSATN